MLAFLFTAVAISLSGVMAPGPITAATLAAGSRSRHAGAMIALGHAVVEIPLILLLVAGLGTLLQSPAVRTAIGFAGGAFLTWMGVQLLLSLRSADAGLDGHVHRRPFVTGIVLTGANPYFLVWWATVGLALTSDALSFGIGALALFAIVHWLCDLGWLEMLSLAGHTGTERFGGSSQKAISAVCGVVLLGFGVKFLHDAAIAAGLIRW
ncbi:MAG: LysE family transporter [Rhodopirellula sp.]|nr:LysE family transporter [Rhodopirellula sp.]